MSHFFSRFSGSFNKLGSFVAAHSINQRLSSEATMSKAWQLAEDDFVQGCVVPTDDPWRMPVCAECGKVAYRVMVVGRPGSDNRQVPLCGGHFTSACLKNPELNKYNRGGKIG